MGWQCRQRSLQSHREATCDDQVVKGAETVARAGGDLRAPRPEFPALSTDDSPWNMTSRDWARSLQSLFAANAIVLGPPARPSINSTTGRRCMPCTA
jgi:hypothetical protein